MCVSSRLDRDKGFREKEKGQVPKIQRQPKTKITERKIKRKKKRQSKREPNSNSEELPYGYQPFRRFNLEQTDATLTIQ
jgi:hypothetical protein